MGGGDPPTTTDPAPGPQPSQPSTGTETQVGPNYNTGLVTKSDGTFDFMPTHILTRNSDRFEYTAQPTSATYRSPDDSSYIPTVMKGYTDAMSKSASDYVVDYADFDYSDSILFQNGVTHEVGWNFTSPYTGMQYRFVLPFFYWEYSDTKDRYCFFVEIFNDYQALHGFDVYDPELDGAPAVTWVGVIKINTSFFRPSQSMPPYFQSILPKRIPYIDTQGGISITAYHNIYAHFDRNRYRVKSNRMPVRYARHYSYGNVERDIEVREVLDRSDPIVDADNPTPTADIPPALLESDVERPVVNSPSPYIPQVFFASWNMVLPTTNGVRLGGENSTTYQTNRWTGVTSLADMNRLINNSDNSSGYNTLYDSGSKTYTVEINCRPVEQAQDPLNYQFGGSDAYKSYYSKWVVQTQFPSGVTTSNYQSWQEWPATFVGIGWDGTGNGGQILADNYGCMRLVSQPFARTLFVPGSKTGPFTGRFNEVLSLVKSNIVAYTGRHQTPFTWYAREGFVRFYNII